MTTVAAPVQVSWSHGQGGWVELNALKKMKIVEKKNPQNPLRLSPWSNFKGTQSVVDMAVQISASQFRPSVVFLLLLPRTTHTFILVFQRI